MLKQLLKQIIPQEAISLLVKERDMRGWERRRYAPPSPQHIKREILLRNGVPGSTWVETGTYLGATTLFLSKTAKLVYTIEPEPTLFKNAAKLFEGCANIKVINGKSENVLPELLPGLVGDVCFWLDGHYSAGITYQGSQDTPIRDELRCIGANLGHFDKACILIDDVRCFDPTLTEYSGYPPLDFLVDWARWTGLRWQIENDIFITKNY